MANHQSNKMRLTGVLSCKRGFPSFAFLKALQSLPSNSIASSSHSTNLYRKCVTLANFLLFLWAHILCFIDTLLLPIYTTVSLNNNSYAPASLGDFLAVLSSKGCSLFRISGISYTRVFAHSIPFGCWRQK